MIVPELPWLPGAGLEILRADTTFMTLCGSRVDSAPPGEKSAPYAVVWAGGSLPEDAAGVTWKAMLQVSAWSPELTGRDVQGVVWQIAARAAAVLGGIDGYRWRNFGFNTRVMALNHHQPDRTRGDANVLYGAYTQVELIGQVF